MERTGVSQRTLQDWVKSGLIKKEKRAGVQFLWVEDLVRQTPLQQNPEPETQQPELLTPQPSGGSLSLNRQLSQQFAEGLELQKRVLGKIESLEISLKQQNPLDPAVVRELSLLGNVFRSIHQQNEKVGLALSRQEQQLSDLLQVSRQTGELEGRLEHERERSRWTTTTLLAVLFITGVAAISKIVHDRFEGDRALEQVRMQKEMALSLAAEERRRLNRDLDALALRSHEQEKELRETTNRMEQRHQSEKQALSSDFHSGLSELSENHRREIEHLRQAHEQALDAFKKVSEPPGTAPPGKDEKSEGGDR